MQFLVLVLNYVYHPATLSEAFSVYFTVQANMHGRNTGIEEDIHLSSCRLTQSFHCSKINATSMWNMVPSDLMTNR
jgi:hypothetical protein